MRATVYFVTLTKEQRDTLNLGGWGSPIGRAYLAAREGDYATAEARALLKVAAILDAEAHMPDDVWVKLQNVDSAWKDRTDLSCETAFPRSMDLGDVIHWQNGRAEVCAAVGFKPAPLAFTETGGVVILPAREELERRIRGHGYTLLYRDYCEDSETPGLLGQIRGKTNHETRRVTIARNVNTCDVSMRDVLAHELRHIEEPTWDCGSRDVLGRGAP